MRERFDARQLSRKAQHQTAKPATAAGAGEVNTWKLAGATDVKTIKGDCMIDNLIIFGYLVIVTYMGYSCRKLGGFREFAISHGNYGWLAIFCTLSATFIGGGFSTGNAAKVFTSGIAYPLALFGFSLQIILVALFIAPRVKAFPGALSVGDIMEPAYGRRARVITGVFSVLICAGILGAQIGALGAIFNVVLGLSVTAGILIGCATVFFYSTVGGMAAVVKTDILQVVLLIIGIPMVFALGVSHVGGWDAFISAIPVGHLRILGEGMTPTVFASLFLVFVVGETLVPPYVQRLLIGRDARATTRGNFASGIVSVPFFVVAGGIGLIALQLNPSMNSNLAMPETVKLVAPIGLAGLIIAGMISIVMSSADSFLNASSVALVQDVWKPLSRKVPTEEQSLNVARWTNLLTGALALIFALSIPNVLDILIAAYDFWAPTILVPLAAVLLGFRVAAGSFYAAVIPGVIGTLAWDRLLERPWGVQGFLIGTVLAFASFLIANGMARKRVYPSAA
jgi:SSS family solute:Na+ symporter